MNEQLKKQMMNQQKMNEWTNEQKKE